jgi:hypothetical protein
MNPHAGDPPLLPCVALAVLRVYLHVGDSLKDQSGPWRVAHTPSAFVPAGHGAGALEQIRVDENRLGRFIDPVNLL